MDDDDYHIDPEFLRKFSDQYGDVDHPLFWDEIPRDPAGNEDLEALQQLLADGETRESIAEKYKEVGNGYVQQGAYYYDAAISSYTKGIDAQGKNEKLNAQLYVNRALVHLKKSTAAAACVTVLAGDFVKCVDDCRNAIKRDPTNVKAYYRGAAAAYELELYKKALAFCIAYHDHVKEHGETGADDLPATLEAGSPDLLNVYKRTIDRLRERDEQIAAIKKREDKSKEEELTATRGVLKLLTANGIKLQPNLYEIPQSQNVVFYQDNGCLHTSCLLIYDELGVTDYIENFDYSTTVGDHLDVMFQDQHGEKAFKRHNSKCFYETARGDYHEFGTHETLATIIYVTKVAYRVAPVHVVHKDFDIKTLIS
ncbi:hypothetical protein, conserved [Babesia bigemina]|uniref:Uncharacterized protein n=1 Tax=Babesia bigemina TaxID=5866 RepID=A0A061D9Y2_BABBI|nr:hypothetical protein, conserved [Babesia bigemina]CDR96777.1 hypothetical protein, conserved [Babesia bigemina]|eukprot:XP_012768963.1 hypothetical protein, conserved [Babesia bigemina]